jgi:hypothetical protein
VGRPKLIICHPKLIICRRVDSILIKIEMKIKVAYRLNEKLTKQLSEPL